MSELEKIINELKGKKVAGVYKITSPSGKIYVGSSVDLRARLMTYARVNCATQPKLYASFVKYGVHNHNFIILEECEESLLNEKELEHGSIFDSTSRGNLNLKLGNRVGVVSDELKKKLSLAHKDKKRKPLSEETKRKISESHKGKDQKPPSQETRDKISKTLTGRTRGPLSEETKEKLRKANLGKTLSEEGKLKVSLFNKGKVVSKETGGKISKALTGKKLSQTAKDKLSKINSKPISQYTLNMVFIKDWSSSKVVRQELGINHSSRCASGKQETAGGFIWKFKKDYEDPV